MIRELIILAAGIALCLGAAYWLWSGPRSKVTRLRCQCAECEHEAARRAT